MLQGIPHEGAPVAPPQTEVPVGEDVLHVREMQSKSIETSTPVAYLPKEMPTDPQEYRRTLANIYAQAEKIVSDCATERQARATHEELSMLAHVSDENKKMREEDIASGSTAPGFFARLGNWIKG